MVVGGGGVEWVPNPIRAFSLRELWLREKVVSQSTARNQSQL
jgi:hypothetical protein